MHNTAIYSIIPLYTFTSLLQHIHKIIHIYIVPHVYLLGYLDTWSGFEAAKTAPCMAESGTLTLW